MLPLYGRELVVLANFNSPDAELGNIQRLRIDLWGDCAYSEWVNGHREKCC